MRKLLSLIQTDGNDKPMEIAFGEINQIIIDILLAKCHFVLFHYGSMNVPITDKTPGDFRIWCAHKKDFVAANIVAIIAPRYVCSDPNEIKKPMFLLVTVHTERDKKSPRFFTEKRVCLSLRYRR